MDLVLTFAIEGRCAGPAIDEDAGGSSTDDAPSASGSLTGTSKVDVSTSQDCTAIIYTVVAIQVQSPSLVDR